MLGFWARHHGTQTRPRRNSVEEEGALTEQVNSFSRSISGLGKSILTAPLAKNDPQDIGCEFHGSMGEARISIEASQGEPAGYV